MFQVLKSFVQQSWLVLALATGLSAGLAGIDYALRDQIAEQARRRLDQSIMQVVPRAASTTPVPNRGQPLYRVEDAAGATCGWATIAEGRGFQDRIRVLIGLSADGETVTGLKILDSHETPGLGDRIQQSSFLDQFAGAKTDQPYARVKPGQTAAAPIHAITGATISSQAIIDAVNGQLAAIRGTLGNSDEKDDAP